VTFDHLGAVGQAAVVATLTGRQVERLDVLFGAVADARKARLALGRALERQRSAFYDGNDASLAWAYYIEALLEAGDTDRAKALGARVTDPVVIIAMNADRRFDPVIEANPKLKDPVAAAQRRLAWTREEARRQPRSLAARVAVIRALVALDRPQDALEAAEDATRAMAGGTRANPTFDDMNDQSQIIEAWKDGMLVRLGHREQAIAALTSTAACHCEALSTLQLGSVYLHAGDARQAQRWLQDVETDLLVTDDLTALTQERVCAAAQLGDRAGVDAGLAYLQAHAAWSGRAVVAALLCAGRADDAARTFRSQLENPRTRLLALQSAQIYADPDHEAFTARQRADWARMLARPDVREAVDKVGRSTTVPLGSRGALS
jgi:tetratricopeptide (TPR) repeat protein